MKKALIRPVAVIILLLLGQNVVVAQKSAKERIDSIRNELPRLKDTAKVKALMEISAIFFRTNFDSCFAPVTEALRLAEEIHWKKGIANANNNLGLFMTDTGNSAGARQHFEISYALNKELNSTFNIINNLVNIGRTYAREGQYPKAYDYYFRALPIAEGMKNENQIALVTNNISDAYYKQKNYAKAVEYAQKTLDNASKANNTRHMASALSQMGAAKLGLKDSIGARKAYDSGLVVAKQSGSKVDEAAVLSDLANVEPNVRKQLEILLDAGKLLKQVNPVSVQMMVNNANTGSAYFQMAKDSATGAQRAELLVKANDYLSRAKAMAESQNNQERLAQILLMRVQAENLQGNYKQALEDLLRSNGISDSLQSQEKKNDLAELEGKHALTLKDQELALNQLKLSNQRKTSIGLVAGLLILVAFGVLLYRQSLNRKKANAALTDLNLKLYEANQVKARFFGIISHDFRGPVANLLHFLHIQKEDPELLSEADRARHQQEITQSAENLLSTMESMLLWSKEQMENFRPNVSTMPVGQLFEYLQKFFGQPSNVRLIFDEVSGLNLTTDENYLRTIMQNLTSNAVKVVKDRPDAVVEWKAEQKANQTILSITDNGPGLTPDQAKALTTDGLAYNARDGFGFHVIRDLAKAIHCKVDVESEPGKGTVFYLTLENKAVV